MMETKFTQHLVTINRRLRNVEHLLLEIFKQQRQQEQLSLLVEMLSVMKQQSLPKYQEEEWLDGAEVMRLYQVSRSTLFRWKQKDWIKPRKLGKRDFYLRREVESLFHRA